MKLVRFVILILCLVISSCISSRHRPDESFESIFPTEKMLSNDRCLIHLLSSNQFSRNDSLKYIMFSGNKSVPERSFEMCANLEDVLLDDSISKIENNAFFSCRKLRSINLGRIDSIGRNAFKFTSIDSIDLSFVKFIDEFAFSQCQLLHHILFSFNLVKIGDFAFASNQSLSELQLPSSVVGDNAFMHCENLSIVRFEYKQEKPLQLGNSSFLGCKSLKWVSLPEGLTTLPDNVFADCSSLDSIVFPASLESIGQSAFEGSSFRSLSIPQKVSRIGHRAFADCDKLRIVFINNKDIIIADDSFPEETSIVYTVKQ